LRTGFAETTTLAMIVTASLLGFHATRSVNWRGGFSTEPEASEVVLQ